jgi:hypothetical protein
MGAGMNPVGEERLRKVRKKGARPSAVPAEAAVLPESPTG